MAASAALQCLTILALVAGSLAGSINCGNSAGPSCSNWFNNIHCDSADGACCHDDFNGWCCPPGFKCNGAFSDPGGNTHCMTDSKVSGSCLCEQTDYEIIAMDPVGETQVENSWDDDLTACCQYPTQNCGWSTTITKKNSQQVSWSDAATVGYSMTWNVEAGPALKLGEIGFSVQDTFTYGQTSTTSSSQSYTNGCICTSSECKGPFTKLTFKLRLVYSTQPVQITIKKCGVTKKLSGTVKTTQWEGNSECDIKSNLTSCPSGTELMGEETPEIDSARSTVHLHGAIWFLSLLCCALASK